MYDQYRIACEARSMGIPVVAMRGTVVEELEFPIPSSPDFWDGARIALNPALGDEFSYREDARIVNSRKILGTCEPDHEVREVICRMFTTQPTNPSESMTNDHSATD